MNIDFVLLADAATVDGSGKLNILGVLDRIQAQEFPARHGRIAMVLRFSADPDDAGKHEVEIRLRDPEDQEVLKVGGQIQFTPRRGAGAVESGAEGIKVPQVLNLDGIQFAGPGRYRFEVSVDGEVLASAPLRLETFAGTGPPMSPGSGQRGAPGFVLVSGDPAEA